VAKRKLKSGADAHEFTTEDAAKGGEILGFPITEPRTEQPQIIG